jgi:hypothetical protein
MLCQSVRRMREVSERGKGKGRLDIRDVSSTHDKADHGLG